VHAGLLGVTAAAGAATAIPPVVRPSASKTPARQIEVMSSPVAVRGGRPPIPGIMPRGRTNQTTAHACPAGADTVADVTDPRGDDPVESSHARRITRDAVGIGVATGAYALSFGAISVASGLNPAQTQFLSLFMFTGASQFALVGVLGAGGGAIAAILTAWLLGARNSFYALALAPVIRPRGLRILGAAHMTIDESTAMSLAHAEPVAAARRAFWHTGLAIFVLWNIGTLVGALGAAALDDPNTLGLDAAIPAGFIALLWPRLVDRTMWAIALASAALALALTPLLRPGVPVLASGLVALAAAWLMGRRR
jgi:predicted branched-subunit amino acid permease